MLKNILLIGTFLLLSYASLTAQSPSSISYQAVACDIDGNELVSQKISIRATIFSGGPNGDLSYQEVHSQASLITDDYGLFTIEIGNGSIQAGSPVSSLTEIDWSLGQFWLRVEMDPQGGVNFKLVGANQLLSVPYAFYAEEARSAKSAQSAQSAQVAVVAQYADTANYVAPNTYIVNAINAVNSDTALYTSLAGMAIQADNAENALHALKADTAEYAHLAGLAINATNADEADHALLSDTALYAHNAGNAAEAAHALIADNATEAAHALLSDTALYAYNAGHAATATDATNAVTAQSALTALDDDDKDAANELQGLRYDSSGVLQIVPAAQGDPSVMLQSPQNFSSPASSLSFPEGIKGDYLVIPDQYTVPIGKHLYLTAAGATVFLPVFLQDHPTAPTMPTFPESTIISNCRCTGLLVDASSAVDVEVLNFNSFQNFEYTVPSGKVFMVKSGLPTNDSRLEIKAPGANSFILFDIGTAPNQAAIRMPIFPAGTVIRKPPSLQNLVLTALLIDEF